MAEDIFDLFSDELDKLGFAEYIPRYEIFDKLTGLPVLCKHCNQNNWICSGEPPSQVFECVHPELSTQYNLPITVLDSIPAHKVYIKDQEDDTLAGV